MLTPTTAAAVNSRPAFRFVYAPPSPVNNVIPVYTPRNASGFIYLTFHDRQPPRRAHMPSISVSGTVQLVPEPNSDHPGVAHVPAVLPVRELAAARARDRDTRAGARHDPDQLRPGPNLIDPHCGEQRQQDFDLDFTQYPACTLTDAPSPATVPDRITGYENLVRAAICTVPCEKLPTS